MAPPQEGPLKPYEKASVERLQTMTLDESYKIDAHNDEIYAANKRLFDAAKRIAESLDPTNRQIRNMELAPPKIDHTAIVMERLDREAREAEDL